MDSTPYINRRAAGRQTSRAGARITSRVCALLLLVFTAGAAGSKVVAQNGAGAAARASVGHNAAFLERSVERLAEISGGTVGVSAVHVETGRRISLNGDARFPMASVYKIPIAVQLMHRVERGEVRLSDTLTLTARDFRAGHSPLAEFAKDKPVTLTVERLLELMLGESDNSASDALMKMAGGPAAVTQRLRALGFSNIDVNRFEAQLVSDWYGLRELPPESEWSLKHFNELFEKVTPEQQEAAQEKFAADPRDTSTPEAMTALLVRLHRREILAAPNAEKLLKIMTDTQTGGARLKGMLPPGTAVAHKTGNMGARATNDAGIITLPDNAGHVAVTIFVKSSTKEAKDRERAIAEIARTIYDFFLLQRPAP